MARLLRMPEVAANTLEATLSEWPGTVAELINTMFDPSVTYAEIVDQYTALASELVHGKPASLRDPARFAFAHGGKDGHPYPVNREVYDGTVWIRFARADSVFLKFADAAARDAFFTAPATGDETGGDQHTEEHRVGEAHPRPAAVPLVR